MKHPSDLGTGPLISNGVYHSHESFGPRVRRAPRNGPHAPHHRRHLLLIDSEPAIPPGWRHLIYVIAVGIATLAAAAIFSGGFR